MRDTLPEKVRADESGIVNLDSNTGDGTHWVAYFVKGGKKVYFDSFGLDPPDELKKYLGSGILLQTFQLQRREDFICGHLCLHVLKELAAGNKKFKEIILALI